MKNDRVINKTDGVNVERGVMACRGIEIGECVQLMNAILKTPCSCDHSADKLSQKIHSFTETRRYAIPVQCTSISSCRF